MCILEGDEAINCFKQKQVMFALVALIASPHNVCEILLEHFAYAVYLP